jgi:hypothetical protein
MSATWRQMLITKPPLERLTLIACNYDCDTRMFPQEWSTEKYLQNPRGITLGDVTDVSWQIQLPRNAGLVPDNQSCRGWYVHIDAKKVCTCYHLTSVVEREHELRMEDLKAEKERYRNWQCRYMRLNRARGLMRRLREGRTRKAWAWFMVEKG